MRSVYLLNGQAVSKRVYRRETEIMKEKVSQENYENSKATRAAEEALLKRGPDQPCMSTFNDGVQWSVRCVTGLPADQPHQHRGLGVGSSRVTAAWGHAWGNPWEDEERKKANDAWLIEEQWL